MSVRSHPNRAEANATGQFLMPDLFTPGWGRHLPMSLLWTLMAVASVATSLQRGDEMWGTLEGHSDVLIDENTDEESKDRERAFEEAYGKPIPQTVRGRVAVLVDLGLVIQSTEHGEDVLDLPDQLPLPEDKLKLSETERKKLAEMRYMHPVSVATSAIVAFLEQRLPAAGGDTTLDALEEHTGHSTVILREALAQMVNKRYLRVSPAVNQITDQPFTITPLWKKLRKDFMRITVNPPEKWTTPGVDAE